jgi:hypothetical protein
MAVGTETLQLPAIREFQQFQTAPPLGVPSPARRTHELHWPLVYQRRRNARELIGGIRRRTFVTSSVKRLHNLSSPSKRLPFCLRNEQ